MTFERVLVAGAGQMGAGIAQVVAASGREVLLYDTFPGAVERGLETMRRSLAKLHEKGGAAPDEVLALTETLEALMAGLDETERAILSMRLQEYTVEEIAGTIGNISERKVYRVLAAVRKRLERLQGE